MTLYTLAYLVAFLCALAGFAIQSRAAWFACGAAAIIALALLVASF